MRRVALALLGLPILLPASALAQTIGQTALNAAPVLSMGLRPPGLSLGLDLRPPGLEEHPAAPAPAGAGAVLDWYPGAGGFRLSGGFRDAPRPDERRQGFVPYVGIGWRGAVLDGNVQIGLDFGALYQGRPDLRVREEAPDAPGTGGAEDPVQAARFQPVFSLAFTYRF